MEATVHDDRTQAKTELVQFLTFTLAGEEFALPILQVQEIKGHSGFTPIPNSPAWVKGVMNLRGTVVPVFDLRVRLGLPSEVASRFSVVIVVNVAGKVSGLLVDAVSEVVSVPRTAIEPPPDMAGESQGSITGLFRSNERLVVVVGVERVCRSAEATPVAQA